MISGRGLENLSGRLIAQTAKARSRVHIPNNVWKGPEYLARSIVYSRPSMTGWTAIQGGAGRHGSG